VTERFIKSLSIKFHGHPSNGSRADTFGHTGGRIDEQTGKTKLLGAFRYYAKVHDFFFNRGTNSSGMLKFL
jgi:hypothetical protein